MKKLILITISCVLLCSCNGKDGIMGPIGPQGNDGTTTIINKGSVTYIYALNAILISSPEIYCAGREVIPLFQTGPYADYDPQKIICTMNATMTDNSLVVLTVGVVNSSTFTPDCLNTSSTCPIAFRNYSQFYMGKNFKNGKLIITIATDSVLSIKK